MAKALTLLGISKPTKKQIGWLLPAWLWLCLILGGASQGGLLANLVLQAGGAAMIAWGLWSGRQLHVQSDERLPLYLLAGGLLWVLIMFVPLPPAIWQLLPGRAFVADGYRLLGIELPWLSMALAPDRALRSLLALLPPFVAWLLVRRMDDDQRRRMISGVVVVAVISAALGLMQMSTGQDSVLRFYSPTNRDAPVGFFANTNHFSAFLACSLPLAAAWVATVKPSKLPKREHLIGLAILAGFIALALVVGRSLSGLAFLALALIGSVQIIWGRFVSGRAKMLLLGGAAIALLVSASSLTAIGTGLIGAKFEDVPNSRVTMTPVTMIAGTEMTPTGSGLGSFAQVYAMHQPDHYTSTTWVNHAHNDYAELYLELGIPGIVLVAFFLFWFVWRGFRIWQSRAEPDMLVAQAAWLSAALLLLHSFVDYPLRTAALASLFAVAIGLICKSSDADEKPKA